MDPRWKDFAAALGAVLEWLPSNSTLIINESRPYGQLTQFAKWPDGLHAEAGGRPPRKSKLRRLLSPPSESERAEEVCWDHFEERLAGAGWSPPLKGGSPHWWRELPASATRHDYDALAAEVTRIFAAELRVIEPTDLEYTAWQDGEPRWNGIPRFSHDLELDSLGLTRFATP